MSLFFALSGFLITSTLIHNHDVYEFLVKRLARIVPLAYAYTFLVFTFVIFDPKVALWTATFLINYFSEYMVDNLNNHFWSLCVEVHFYLAIALIALFWPKKGLWIVWPACLIVTALRVNDGAYVAIQTHLRADEILAGACVATLVSKFMDKVHDLSNNTDCPCSYSVVHIRKLLFGLVSIPEAVYHRVGAGGRLVP